MNRQPFALIEGQVEADDPRESEYESLRAQIRQLQSDVRAANDDAARSKRESAHALGMLRKQLTPLYRALQAVFGELDAVDAPEADAPANKQTPRASAVWESWKSRLGGRKAQAIDALLLHGELNTQQLAIAMGCSRNTIPGVIFELNKAGLINKAGGRFSLKQL